MTYKILLSRLGYRLFDAGLCVQCLGILIVRDLSRWIRRGAEAKLTEAALQFQELDEHA